MRLSLLTALATTALTAPSPAPVEDPVVAVVDTGVNLGLPAFAGRAAGGADFVPHETGDFSDHDGHGTAVAALIAGQAPDGRPYGVAGVGRILALRVGARPRMLSVLEAFDYAAASGARVVNASFTGPLDGAEPAIRAHPEVLFVAGAGNDGSDVDAVPSAYWPCTSTAPNVLCVAAADRHGRAAPFTDRGAQSVDLAARGRGTRAVTRSGAPQRFTGTSAATALVSGAAAYLWSLAPQATAVDVKRALLAGARPAASWTGRSVTGGVLDVGAAAAALTGGPVVALPPSLSG